jgi:hypothetical protein
MTMTDIDAIGFTSCGDGGAEVASLLALLGLPNTTTMEKRSFPMIEERMSGFDQHSLPTPKASFATILLKK